MQADCKQEEDAWAQAKSSPVAKLVVVANLWKVGRNASATHAISQ